VKNVWGFHGATVINIEQERDYAYTIGSYITGNFNRRSISYDNQGNLTEESSTLIHKYGHYLQGRAWGTIPYIVGGFNSADINNELESGAWSERDASLRGMEYFRNKGFSMQGYGGATWPENLPRSKARLGWISGLIFSGIAAIIIF